MKIIALFSLLLVGCQSNTPTPPPLESPLHVLILGDSISIGYTPQVRESLGTLAQVVRPMRANGGAENCAGTTYGVANVARWLELDGADWDVIHFNFGLHDLKHVDPETGKNSNNPNHARQAEPDVYGEQLRAITEQLVASEARLIFGTTTPIPDGELRPLRTPEDVRKYNSIALGIMADFDITVNDLYSFMEPQMEALQQPVNVHFNRAGSVALGDQVAGSILAVAGLASVELQKRPNE